MHEGSYAILCEWVQLHDEADVNNIQEAEDKPEVIKHIIKRERAHVVITAKLMLELMTHEDLLVACGARQKILSNG